MKVTLPIIAFWSVFSAASASTEAPFSPSQADDDPVMQFFKTGPTDLPGAMTRAELVDVHPITQYVQAFRGDTQLAIPVPSCVGNGE